MTPSEFLERISEILNVDRASLSMESVLKDYETFDSVAVLSILVLLDELDHPVSGLTIRGCTTVADLWSLAHA